MNGYGMIGRGSFFALFLIGASLTPCLAQGPRVPFRAGGEPSPGIGTFVPERWGLVGVAIANPTDQPVDLLSAHFFPSDPDLQFARQLWVPPQAKRSTWYPVRPPRGPVKSASIPVKSILVDRATQPETYLRDYAGALVREGLLPARSKAEAVTGMVGDGDDEQLGLMVQVARVAFRMSPRMSWLGQEGLPPIAEGLDALDNILIASDQLFAEPAGAAALRHWLHRGGRAWVQLERVAPAAVSQLLGEDFPCTIVDRVGLTRWQFVNERNPEEPDSNVTEMLENPDARLEKSEGNAEQAIRTFEAPVDMVRVVAPGSRPLHTIDGWPASFWRRCGRGWVLFTTVSPRGWVEYRPETDKQRHSSDNPVAKYMDTDPLQFLAAAFLKKGAAAPIEPAAFAPLLTGEVGHHILGRGMVLLILGGFCAGLLGTGFWLQRRGDLAHLGWIGPLAAVGTAVLLFALGWLMRSQVPPTAAVAQFVEAIPGVPEADVSGMMAFYSLGDTEPRLGAEHGGVFVVDRSAQTGSTRRMVWTDLSRWHFENMPLSAGMHWAPFEQSRALDEPLSARVTFGPDGVIGTLRTGPWQKPSDALLALPSRRNVSVRFTGEDRFVATPEDQLAPEAYLASGLLSDEQRRRQDVYRDLLGKRLGMFPAQPTLLTWTEPDDLGFTYVEGARRSGSALLAVPLQIERPAPGTHIRIPAAFLTHQSIVRPGFALLFSFKKNEWVTQLARPARTMLRFQLPSELLPVRIERAVLHVDVQAQGYPFDVLSGPDKWEVLATRNSPVGRLRFDLDRADVLQPDANGSVHLGLAVGDVQKKARPDEKQGEWRITDAQLELIGRIPEDNDGKK